MTIKTYDYLPEEARFIRQTVFVEEQGFKEEFDSIDSTAVHAVAFIDGAPAATGRIFPSDEDGVFYLGRLAVIKDYRKGGTGSAMIKHLESEASKRGAVKIKLHAQVRAKGFYEKSGYTAEGEAFLEEFEPHITMVKSLKY
ncbi:MAG: GNAT family N-acetyltransferase [Oscillospiraceae bacterium]